MAKKSMTCGPSPVGKATMTGKGSTPSVRPMPSVKGGKKTEVGKSWGGGGNGGR